VRQRFWRRGFARLAETAAIGLGLLCLPQLLITSSASHLYPAVSLLAFAGVPVLLAVAGSIELPTAMCGLAGNWFLIGSGINLHARDLPWLLAPLAAAAVLAGSLLAAEKRVHAWNADILFVQCVAAASFFGLSSRVAGEDAVSWSFPLVARSVLSSVLVAALGYLLFYALLRRLGAGKVSTLQWAQTLVTTGEAAFVLRVRPGWEGYLGAALIVTALARALLANRAEEGVMLEITRP
jgi:drug/metabolite transporter (DMT)-like permease